MDWDLPFLNCDLQPGPGSAAKQLARRRELARPAFLCARNAISLFRPVDVERRPRSVAFFSSLFVLRLSRRGTTLPNLKSKRQTVATLSRNTGALFISIFQLMHVARLRYATVTRQSNASDTTRSCPSQPAPTSSNYGYQPGARLNCRQRLRKWMLGK